MPVVATEVGYFNIATIFRGKSGIAREASRPYRTWQLNNTAIKYCVSLVSKKDRAPGRFGEQVCDALKYNVSRIAGLHSL